MADRRRTPSRLLALLFPLALLAPVAAHAEKVVTRDVASDAQLVTTTLPLDESSVVTTDPAPDETAVDITRTVVAHGTTRLRVTVHLRDLVLDTAHQTFVHLVTPQGRFEVLVGKNPGLRAQSVLTKRGIETDCRGRRATVDGGADTVSISLPTACIGAPRWVRIGVRVTREARLHEDSATPSEYTEFADDGHRGVVRENSLGLGPRVHRG